VTDYLKPTGFWSYTSSDDAASKGRLSKLRGLLADELQLKIGRAPKVNIFQDVVAIPHGSKWLNEIDNALNNSSFLIAIVTPAFLQSEWCCQEVLRFGDREAKLGRDDLIFPLHYISVDDLEPHRTGDIRDREVLDLLRSRQWVDFRLLRLRDPSKEDVAEWLDTFATSLRMALRRVTPMPSRKTVIPQKREGEKTGIPPALDTILVERNPAFSPLPTPDRPPPLTSVKDIGARVLRSRWFLGPVSAAIIGLLVLSSWPWSFNRFVLKVTTRIVQISASAPGVHEIGVNLAKTEIQIFGAHAKGLPPELAALSADAVSVRLFASSANLQSISLPSGAGLVVRATSNGGTDIGVLSDGSIVLSLSGTIERIDENGQHTKIANIERATGWDIRSATKNSPARLVLPPGAASIAIYNQPISGFSLAPGYPYFQSEILKGELQILDTATKIELEPRGSVLLEGGSRMLSRLEVIDGALAVDLSGEADRISTGTPRPGLPFRLDRDLTPSILSYLLGSHELKLLWGIVVAVLGALWKARQWALKWGK
jgi:TIR domain